MAFHPDKCSTLRISRSKNPHSKTYILKGHTFTTADSKHISEWKYSPISRLTICRMRNRWFSKDIRTSILEFCCSVWSPYTQDYTNKLEMVQRRAARYVTNRYRNTSSVTSMLEHLEWKTLETRHVKFQMTMMFKITHGLVDITANAILQPPPLGPEHITLISSGNIPASTDYYKNSFFPKTIRL